MPPPEIIEQISPEADQLPHPSLEEDRVIGTAVLAVTNEGAKLFLKYVSFRPEKYVGYFVIMVHMAGGAPVKEPSWGIQIILDGEVPDLSLAALVSPSLHIRTTGEDRRTIFHNEFVWKAPIVFVDQACDDPMGLLRELNEGVDA